MQTRNYVGCTGCAQQSAPLMNKKPAQQTVVPVPHKVRSVPEMNPTCMSYQTGYSTCGSNRPTNQEDIAKEWMVKQAKGPITFFISSRVFSATLPAIAATDATDSWEFDYVCKCDRTSKL